MIPLPWVFCEYLFLGENSDTSTKLTKILTLTNRNCLTCELFFEEANLQKKEVVCAWWNDLAKHFKKYLKSKNFFFVFHFILVCPDVHRHSTEQRIKLHEMKKRKNYMNSKIIANFEAFRLYLLKRKKVKCKTVGAWLL